MRLRVYLPVFFFMGTFLLFSQENPGRLSVAATPSPTAQATNQPAPTGSGPTTSNTQPAPTSSGPATTSPATNPEGSNLTDAPLPEVANQPKVIPPSQAQAADGPKGPRDGRWYVGAAGGAMVQQIVESGTVTAVGQQPLNEEDSGRIGAYLAGRVGYDFAVRDVQLAFGGPTPMRTAMELEFNYLGAYEKMSVYPNGGAPVGTETFNLNAYTVLLNGLIKFEELPITPYFGGGVGCAVLYAQNHKLTVNGLVNGQNVDYTTAEANANNVCLALQAIVGIERQLYQNLSMFIEYRFLAYMDVNFNFGSQSTPNGSVGQGGSSSSNDFLANQVVSAGLKWSF
jgi:opacity protein-like surface antigen